MNRRPLLVVPLLLGLALAGCLAPAPTAPAAEGYRALGFDGAKWPDLHGAKVTVLAYKSYGYAFKTHAAVFKNLTNGTVELLTVDDAGKVLERAVAEKGRPTFDVIYGIDNVLLGKAVREGVYAPYKPLLSDRIDAPYRLTTTWEATPVNHGYISVNVDPRANLTVGTLHDVKANAAKFVTSDPRTSTPGLGFLVATVATFGEKSDSRYDYIDYWNDLFKNGALVVSDWDAAYVGRFTGGYGQWETGAKVDKPLVVSYTTSPAYEMYYGYDRLNGNVLAPNATFHQIQTVGIAKGAKNSVAAQAWIEFALTDGFQKTAAELEAIYPVAKGVNVTHVFAGRDPAPGTFAPAGFTYQHLDANVQRWLREWTDAYEAHRAG